MVGHRAWRVVEEFEQKRCSRCDQEKPLGMFYKRLLGPDGHASECKACRDASSRAYVAKNKEAQLRRQRQWYQKNKRHSRSESLRRRFGVSADTYDEMVASQNGLCLACGEALGASKKNHPIDHCHRTGAIRGVVHDICNRSMGLVRDDPAKLRKLAAYLESRA